MEPDDLAREDVDDNGEPIGGIEGEEGDGSDRDAEGDEDDEQLDWSESETTKKPRGSVSRQSQPSRPTPTPLAGSSRRPHRTIASSSPAPVSSSL